MTTALQIITDAFDRLNRLSPGETLSDDDADFALRRLNSMRDELGTQGQVLYKSVTTTAAQTGNITLGAGSWAAIAPGSTIVSCTVEGLPIERWNMQQYHESADATTGSPRRYAPDGLSTVYLYPLATGQDVSLLTLAGASEFADLSTDYVLPPGYKSMYGACLAVRLAPTLLGKTPPDLLRAEREARSGIASYTPAIIDARSYSYSPGGYSILNG
jgi:hypothetical protein